MFGDAIKRGSHELLPDEFPQICLDLFAWDIAKTIAECIAGEKCHKVFRLIENYGRNAFLFGNVLLRRAATPRLHRRMLGAHRARPDFAFGRVSNENDIFVGP